MSGMLAEGNNSNYMLRVQPHLLWSLWGANLHLLSVQLPHHLDIKEQMVILNLKGRRLGLLLRIWLIHCHQILSQPNQGLKQFYGKKELHIWSQLHLRQKGHLMI